ncbi:2-dehydropantoate 2-reductase (plasmid) [Caballeronia sp. NK8]|uniref:ketopantoate reductase family protein n=1 Tax=Caballeronia sp. NK8 TaxID=140098 RepID=UPI001BB5FD21|nr:2-dehydropantoate 2-reductase [Caballeronia sp. NK8]BCQ28149.1 2-dehydropantoate 2-reductase [Caballeronia sp. NK8]
MRTLIIGAGAIGCYLACKLSDAGADVTLHGLGPAFQRIAETGVDIAVRDDMQIRRVTVNCTLTPPAPAGWDLLVFAVKAQDLPRAAHQFSAHAREAIVLLPQNGLPYWQFLGVVTPEMRLASVDPDGVAESALPLARIAGCVVTKGLTVLSDGALVETVLPADSFAIGDVVANARVAKPVVSLLRSAGLPAKEVVDIRIEKWRKLLVNVAFNPLGAISHLGFGEVLDIEAGERLARAIVCEALDIAAHFGVQGVIDLDAAMNRARSSRLHKTSMLQDTEAGRRLEVEPILGALLELAHDARLRVPTLEAICDCARLIDHALVKGPIRQIAKTP